MTRPSTNFSRRTTARTAGQVLCSSNPLQDSNAGIEDQRITLWNSLPDFVVKVNSINVFKKRLDKYWSYQESMFDYTADIAGIGDRSEFTVDIDLS